MRHADTITIRAALWALLGIACLAPAPAMAWDQNPQGKCVDPRGCGASPSPAPGGGGYSAPSYDYGAAQRAQAAAEAAAAAERQHRQDEANRIERERLAAEQRKKEKDAAFIRDRDAAANTLKGSSGSAMSQLKGLSGADSSGLKGSGFDQGGQLKSLPGADTSVADTRNEPAGLGGKSDFKGAFAKPAPTVPSGDPMVVDARNVPSGLQKSLENAIAKAYPDAPPGVSDRVRKGFQAVMDNDWKVAKAWFEDALNRDPNNAALKRSVDLAQWMVDRPKTKTAKPVTPLGAAIYSASHGDSAEAIRQFELVKKANPAIAPQVDDMINALLRRQRKDAQAADWDRAIGSGTQKMIDGMFDEGINMLSIGDEKGAQKSFNDATFFGGLDNVRPSQLPRLESKPGKTK